MPSQWRQYGRNGLRLDHEPWLEHMLRRPPYDRPAPGFRRRHDRLVGRWAGATGPGRVTVVVVDDRDRDAPMRTFEALPVLPHGLPRPVPETANRSLTLAETEMPRNLDKEFRGNGLPEELYSKPVRHGAIAHMRNACGPTPRDVRIRTPRWTPEAAAGIGAEAAARTGSTGVRILGDPASPSRAPASGGPADAPRLAPEAAARALFGTLTTAAATNGAGKGRTVHRTSSKELVKVLGHRCPERLRLR
ncbi:hypothetical protein ACFFUA_22865 [Streptomyces heliomycini]|uniref:Transposase n=1 Tax=Streptomyces heliomycini TaxID=284032 RepID=A0ABV5LDK2_9ACTN